MLISNADRFISILRNTAYVLDVVAAAASLTPTRQPPRDGPLRVAVAGGTTGSGTVTITGTVGGVAGQSEALVFTGAGAKQTAKRFTAISAITTSGLADEASVPTVAIQSVGADGAPQIQSYVVASDVPAVFASTLAASRWPTGGPGTERVQAVNWRFEDTEVWAPQVGDTLREDDTGDAWLIAGADKVRGVAYSYFWLLQATRI